MPKYIARLSGIVSYSDDSHDQFAAHMDERGNISVNNAAESSQAIAESQSDTNNLEDMFDLVSSTLALSPGDTPAKTVTDLVAELSGRIARDDDTKEDFVVQYNSQSGAHVPSGGNTSVYDEMHVQMLTTMFETLVGSGNATVP